MTEQPFVIVGGGLAGAKGAEALREQGYDGPLVLIGDEPDRPYERPPLSKDYLLGNAERDSAFVHDEAWYTEHDVDLRLGTTVVEIDTRTHTVVQDDGGTVGYAKLLLATGSSPRRLNIPGADAARVHYLRRLPDSDALKATIGSVRRLLVVGGGWIGLEVAAAARTAGVEVTVLEAQELPLLGPLGPELARVFAGLHTDHGVILRTGVGVERFTAGADGVSGAVLADGSRIEADAVVVGVGAAPNLQLAAGAGLRVHSGVVVDARLQSSDPDIVAAGDIAEADHPLLGPGIRVEHWANALNQPAVAASTMLGGDAVYDELPYFYTDQYDLGMEFHGLVTPGGYDDVVYRGDVAAREFISFWLREGRVVAGMNVNVWDVGDPIKALIRSGNPVDEVKLANPAVPLDEVYDT
ncbi:NAD(P)/FAD-dependent oxidoreductase [Jiangella rhizosphaerae]|uniref:NAD(P)/FAD-dependent oxidoreductase n=1 Tax=Jiangella rhizosphaerae TaxID=2293569 RepID=A0A418KTG0_9ACTN|nr:FAD-dependent oxidoreductase [Jiangella rhizosphaerae]RIQ30107.1 NAD(P)/FAD-dependent oxidoreductase [Jiangella rhizosphaerae]